MSDKKTEPKPVTLETAEREAVEESIREQLFKLSKEVKFHQDEAWKRQQKMRLLEKSLDRLTGRI